MKFLIQLPTGGLSIVNVDSQNMLWDLINEYPIGFIFDWVIIPLAEDKTSIVKILKALKS